MMKEQALDCLAITKSWLCNNISDAEIDIPGYIAHRKDRQERSGGGVALYVRDSIQASRMTDLEVVELEVIWLQLNLLKRNHLVACVYRPPNSTPAFHQLFEEIIQKATTYCTPLIIMGDVNMNYLEQDNWNVSKLIESTGNLQLYQMVPQPTRITASTSTLIDLIFVNSLISKITKSVKVIDIGYSDHSLVTLATAMPVTRLGRTSCVESRSYKHLNVDKLRGDMDSIPWGICDIFDDIEDLGYLKEISSVSYG